MTERRKPKLLIIGHARHGKDTIGDMIAAQMKLQFTSSSIFVGRKCVWPQWGQERYCSFDEMFEDRVNFRSTWANLILAFNTPNLSRTATEMLIDNDMYVGMRNKAELEDCIKNKVFDYTIWVDASARLEPESKDSMQLEAKDADLHIDNNGPESNLQEVIDTLQKRLHIEGFDVNYSEPTPQKTTMTDEEQKEYDDLHRTHIGEDLDDETEFVVLQKHMLDEGFEISPMPAPEFEVADASNNPMPVPEFKVTNTSGNPMVVNPTDAEAEEFRSKPSVKTQAECERDWMEMPEGYTQVLDHGFFKVLEIMGSDKTICESARMSYGRGTKKINSDASLINYLVLHKHTSPLEMGEIRFHMRMPIFVMRQWVRHRTANLNEYSGRYSEMVRLFYVPNNDQICTQNKVNKQGSAEPLEDDVATNLANDIAYISRKAFDTYKYLLDQGVSRETARMILPLNTYTEVVWKLDVSNLIKFLILRDDDHAQWEIRQYARFVATALAAHFPMVFAAYVKARNSETFTPEEIGALISGDTTNLSNSQTQRIADLRKGHF